MNVEELPTNKLPIKIDLRSRMPPVYDQLKMGSCSANAITSAVEYDISGFRGSRLFLYYNEKVLENEKSNDSGAILFDGIRALVKYGICEESYYPYIPEHFNKEPPVAAYTNALLQRDISIKKLDNDMNSLKNCLVSGSPFVTSIYIFTSFESDTTAANGVIPSPSRLDENLGGHAILICGYDDASGCWIGQNSWGTTWGDKGYFYLPYVYLLDSSLSSEAWSIRAKPIRAKPIRLASPLYYRLGKTLQYRLLIVKPNSYYARQ